MNTSISITCGDLQIKHEMTPERDLGVIDIPRLVSKALETWYMGQGVRPHAVMSKKEFGDAVIEAIKLRMCDS